MTFQTHGEGENEEILLDHFVYSNDNTTDSQCMHTNS